MTTINVINAYSQCAGGDTSCVAESLVQMKALQADLKTKGVKLEDSERIGLNSYIAGAEAALGNGYGALSAAAMGAAGAKGNEAGNAQGPASHVSGTGGTTPIAITRAAFGHTFDTHGQSQTEFLTMRAAGSGMPTGQFLDDQAAARLIQENLGNLSNGAISVPIPPGFPARVIMPDGTHVPAVSIRIVPSGSGVKTAYPEL